jgi:hypothetical protein
VARGPEALGIAFLFSLTIGTLCAIFIPRISPRLWRYRFPSTGCCSSRACSRLRWGSTITIGILTGIGYIPAASSRVAGRLGQVCHRHHAHLRHFDFRL